MLRGAKPRRVSACAAVGCGGEPAEGRGEPGALQRGAEARGAYAARIADAVAAPAGPYERAGRERGERQPAQSGHPVELRVGGVEQLRPAVQPEAVHGVGGHPAADPVRRLQHADGQARVQQVVRCGEAREARSDHDDVHRRRGVAAC
jgi:hypothetical protein